MFERDKTLYQQIKNNLESNEEVDFIGEVWNFSADYQFPETAKFFVAPRSYMSFEAEEMEDFVNALVVPYASSFIVRSNWRDLTLADGNRTKSLLFGTLSYLERIKSAKDMIKLPEYCEYLQRAKMVPAINGFNSMRMIQIYAYPDANYAEQVYSYQYKLVSGSTERDSLMDWLTHDITREQLDFLSVAERRFHFRLSDFPKPPKLQEHFSGR